MGSLSSGAGEERETQREKMCVGFTLIIANCLLALLGLLLLAGGVWRIVDDGSLREVAKEIRDTQEWDEVKNGVDGLEEAVKEAASHKYFIKEKISNEAAKIDIEHPEKLTPGSKFVQNLFFGVSAGLSAIILFFTITLCCRAR